MIPPVPPGIREIDPGAEAARLAEARKHFVTEQCLYPEILCCSVVQVPPEWHLEDESNRCGISIVVTSKLPHPVGPGLDARIREVIWDSMRKAAQ